MKKTKPSYFLTILFSFLASVLSIVFSFSLSYFITAMQRQDFNLFYKTILFTNIFLLLELIVVVISNKFKMDYVEKSMININNHAFSKDMQSKSDADMATYSTKSEIFINRYLLNKIAIPNCIIQIVIVIVAYLFISPWFVLYMALVTGLMMLIPMITSNTTQNATKKYMICSKEYIKYLNNIFGGKKEIKQYGVLDKYIAEHNNILSKTFEAYKHNGLILRNVNSFTNSFSTLSFIGLQIISGFLVLHGKIELGLLITAIQLMNYFINPVFTLIQSLNEYTSIKAEVPNLKEKLVISNRKKEASYSSKIQLNNLSFTYPNGQEIVFPSNISFEKNKKYVITGKSGSGKSTLAKILCGELVYETGELIIDNKVANQEESFNFLNAITYVPQTGHLFYSTIKDNIALYRDLTMEDIYKAAKFCNLSNELINKAIDEDTEISGGEKARVVLARAIVQMPQILILDEPTANLDYKNSIDIIKKLCNIKDLTLIVITHETEKEILQNFDAVIQIGAEKDE